MLSSGRWLQNEQPTGFNSMLRPVLTAMPVRLRFCAYLVLVEKRLRAASHKAPNLASNIHPIAQSSLDSSFHLVFHASTKGTHYQY